MHLHKTSFLRHRLALASAVLLTAAAIPLAPASADTVHIETTFGPGTWTPLATFVATAPDPGFVGTVTTSDVLVNTNSMLEQKFTANFPQSFQVIYAPVMMDNFIHDPAIHGPIGTVNASVKTFSNAAGAQFFGVMRLYIEQSGRLYTLSNLDPNDSFFGFTFDEPDLIRTTSGRVASDFIECTAGVFDVNSHPDFNGAAMRFGFGYSLTSTGLIGDGLLQVAMRFDTAIVRAYTPVPPCLGDLNNDGLINTVDLTILLAAFGDAVIPGTPGDLNNDGLINTMDLTTFLGLFGTACA